MWSVAWLCGSVWCHDYKCRLRSVYWPTLTLHLLDRTPHCINVQADGRDFSHVLESAMNQGSSSCPRVELSICLSTPICRTHQSWIVMPFCLSVTRSNTFPALWVGRGIKVHEPLWESIGPRSWSKWFWTSKRYNSYYVLVSKSFFSMSKVTTLIRFF